MSFDVFLLLFRGEIMYSKGLLWVISGPMFSGKTSELIRLYDRSIFGKTKSIIVKPVLDTRFSDTHVATHDNKIKKSRLLKEIEELQEIVNLEKPDNVFIDEAQFFSSKILEVIEGLRKSGLNIYVAVLNQTSEGNAFPFIDKKADIGALLAMADYIETFTAVCPVCGKNATKTYKTELSGKEVDVGGSDKYEPRCFEHWEPRK